MQSVLLQSMLKICFISQKANTILYRRKENKHHYFTFHHRVKDLWLWRFQTLRWGRDIFPFPCNCRQCTTPYRPRIPCQWCLHTLWLHLESVCEGDKQVAIPTFCFRCRWRLRVGGCSADSPVGRRPHRASFRYFSFNFNCLREWQRCAETQFSGDSYVFEPLSSNFCSISVWLLNIW